MFYWLHLYARNSSINTTIFQMFLRIFLMLQVCIRFGWSDPVKVIESYYDLNLTDNLPDNAKLFLEKEENGLVSVVKDKVIISLANRKLEL